MLRGEGGLQGPIAGVGSRGFSRVSKEQECFILLFFSTSVRPDLSNAMSLNAQISAVIL